MYQDFVLVDVTTNLFDKTIDIYFNFDIEPNTITQRSLRLIEEESGSVIPIKYAIDGSVVSITLQTDPVPNVDYMLIINREVGSVTEQPLKTEYLRYIRFTSTIKNKVTILSPSNLETVDDLYIVWKEDAENPNPLVSRYRVQVARDNIFHAIDIDTIVTDKTDARFMIPEVDPYQYYIRIRVETESEIGSWSDIVSFVYREKRTDTVVEDSKPVIDIPLTLTIKPENGDTPDSFILTFDEPIDATYLTQSMIHVTRKDW